MKNLLSEHNFIKLWISQLLSQLTIHLVNFSILTRIFEVTQSSVAVSLLWIAYSLPALCAPFSGAIVDSFSRRKMMIATNFLQAIVVSLYIFVRPHQIFILYVLVFLYSLLDQLYLPAQQASIPWLVSKKLLSSANGLFLLTQQGTFLLGFGLGGIFLSLLGRTYTALLTSVFLLIATFSVFLLPRDTAHTEAIETDLGRFWKDFKRGLHFIRFHREVLFPLLMLALTQVFVTIVAIILPSYARNILNIDLNHASIALVIPGALGALAFVFLLPKILKNRRKKSVIEFGLLAASISLLGLSLLSLVSSFKFLFSVLIAIGLGMSITSILVPSQTLLQEKTPTWFRGRVYSSLGFLLILTTSVPLLISATIADLLGTTTLIATLAFLLFVFLIFIHRKGDYVLANGLGF